MKFSTAALFLTSAVVTTTNALELTPDNYDAQTAGKTVFLKFFAPWCGHCKKMKPDWDTLMEEYSDSATALVADVDCTADGKPLCDANGVKGFPTLKWGDPSALEDYQGGRDLASLQTFAKENLKPICSPTNLDLCDAEKKKEIETIQAMSDADLDKKIEEAEAKLETIESEFKTFVEGLQKSYQEANEKKDADLAAVKDSGLGLMKAVKASKVTAAANDEL